MKLGAFLYPTGYHVAAWRHPAVPADAGISFDQCRAFAELAQRAKFDFLFLPDSVATRGTDLAALSRSAHRYVAQFEPFTLISALAAVTERIGLIASATTTYNEPFHIARKFASLDHISGGRAGWNVVTSQNRDEAPNFGLPEHPEHGARYARANEFVAVVRGLWDSWEDDAFPRDKASGQFFEPDKLHVLDHVGEYFKVRGPLNVPRCPQGHPVVVQAGASDVGRQLAAQTADVVFTAQSNLESAKRFYSDVKARSAAAGRERGEPLVMVGVFPFVGETQAAAQQSHLELQGLIDPVVGLSLLEGQLGEIDLSGCPIDGPVPQPAETNASKSRQNLLLDLARRDGMTIRDLYKHVAGARGHLQLIGTARTVVDEMEAWYRGGAADGFIVMPPDLPAGFEKFVKLVIPELRARRLFREEYQGSTLREHLGLARRSHPSSPVAR